MSKLIGEQLSLITESEIDDRPIGDWGWEKLGTKNSLVPNSVSDELGTKNSLVPNSVSRELGTDKSLVPNSVSDELGTKIWLVPNFDEWHPPIGCLQQKWIKDHQYWYWRYYNLKGKKASLYLCKDYNKAIRKAIKIGVPTDAKLPNLSASDSQAQTQNSPTDNIIDIAPTAHSASRGTRAA